MPQFAGREAGFVSHYSGVALWLNKRRLTLSATITGVLAVVISACGAGQTSQPILKTSDLVGTWTGQRGALTFSADHSVEGHDLNVDDPNCRMTISGPGVWQFVSPAGSSSISNTRYKKGNGIFVVFPSQKGTCGAVSLTSWQINGPLGLCIELDPDDPCAAGEPFRRTHLSR